MLTRSGVDRRETEQEGEVRPAERPQCGAICAETKDHRNVCDACKKAFDDKALGSSEEMLWPGGV